MTVRIYHNPRCSKSRATLALLEERGIAPEIIRYLDTPPTADELKEILSLLGRTPRELTRTGEKVYKELALAEADEQTLLTAMAANPILIERPIVIANGRAAVGRPPEAVLAIL
ncbi:MAG: arsenate reductase (glutaredoxin) [Pseudomonadota bacterium]